MCHRCRESVRQRWEPTASDRLAMNERVIDYEPENELEYETWRYHMWLQLKAVYRYPAPLDYVPAGCQPVYGVFGMYGYIRPQPMFVYPLSEEHAAALRAAQHVTVGEIIIGRTVVERDLGK